MDKENIGIGWKIYSADRLSISQNIKDSSTDLSSS